MGIKDKIIEACGDARDWVLDNKGKTLLIGGTAVYLATSPLNPIRQARLHNYWPVGGMFGGTDPVDPVDDPVRDEELRDVVQDLSEQYNLTVGQVMDIWEQYNTTAGALNETQQEVADLRDLLESYLDGLDPVDPVDPVDPTAPKLDYTFGADAKTLRSIIREQGVSTVANLLGLNETHLAELADGESANDEIVDFNGFAVTYAPLGDGTEVEVTMYAIHGEENSQLYKRTVSAQDALDLYDLIQGGN